MTINKYGLMAIAFILGAIAVSFLEVYLGG